MTKEEEKAIERLKNYKEYILKCGNKKSKHFKAVVTVLNMLKEKDEEIEKKNKIINEMIEEYEYNDRINLKNFCDEEIRKDKCIENCTICTIQYFERKASK